MFKKDMEWMLSIRIEDQAETLAKKYVWKLCICSVLLND